MRNGVTFPPRMDSTAMETRFPRRATAAPMIVARAIIVSMAVISQNLITTCVSVQPDLRKCR